jgi:hypothetical protein
VNISFFTLLIEYACELIILSFYPVMLANFDSPLVRHGRIIFLPMHYRINIFLLPQVTITFLVSCTHLINFADLEKIKIIKKKHIYAVQLLKEFMKNPYNSYWGGGDNEAALNTEHAEEIQDIETKDTPYLVAAKHGIVEITSALKLKMKSVIHERNSNNENVLLLAVKYKQPQVVQQLWNSEVIVKEIFESLYEQVDNEENTMLHLAAYTSLNKETIWTISGPAMEMMWDIKWYKVHIYSTYIIIDHEFTIVMNDIYVYIHV